MEQAQEPGSGWLDGRVHLFPVRVYYEDTDFSGVVYHANYLRFMERGRSEFLRLVGAGHQGMLGNAEPLVWAVRRINVDFLKPARMEDALIIRTEVLELAGARMQLHQTVLRGTLPLVTAKVEVCVITLDGRPRRVPNSTRKKLEFFLEN
ncbi:MAG TPA: tol-pal system-associated acyl-CoA thioesterase [Micropepsaceae bacterium]|nr:tol-pal system-associated acyl-CoA thioesterase [Micropepsaceae bacterium]